MRISQKRANKGDREGNPNAQKKSRKPLAQVRTSGRRTGFGNADHFDKNSITSRPRTPSFYDEMLDDHQEGTSDQYAPRMANSPIAQVKTSRRNSKTGNYNHTDENSIGGNSTNSAADEDDRQESPFNLSQFLDEDDEMTPEKKLRKSIEIGDVAEVGRQVRDGVKNGTFNEVQLKEIASSVEPASISIISFIDIVDNANSEKIKEILIGQHFLNSIHTPVQNSLNKVEASLKSLSSTVQKKFHIAARKKGELQHVHISPAVAPFPSVNLNLFYTSKNISGDKAVSQLTNLFSTIFKSILPKEYEIWIFSFRPLSLKAADRNFKLLPKKLVESFKEFGFDALGYYLPARLLTGPIDPEDQFVQTLGKEGVKEIAYRRQVRDTVEGIICDSIGYALQNLRNYHYDLELERLVYCPNRKTCHVHYRWDDVKVFRQRRREAGLNVDEYEIADVMRMAHRDPSTPGPYNNISAAPYTLQNAVE